VDARTDHGSVGRARKIFDLVVVGALLVINAVLSFMQEHRAAGVVEALRKRLQVNARASGASRTGRSFPPGSWFPATSSACAPATSSRRT
jgi:hypothetical protein